MTAMQALRNRNNDVTSASSGDTKMASLTVAKGKTRGKNPREIEYQKFDLEKVDSLPKTLAEFMEVTKTLNNDKPYSQDDLLGFVIDGFNAAQYSAASDEIGEFIPDSWDKETQAQFRLAVRNTSKMAGLDIETVVNMLKPAVEKGLEAKAKAASESKPETV